MSADPPTANELAFGFGLFLLLAGAFLLTSPIWLLGMLFMLIGMALAGLVLYQWLGR